MKNAKLILLTALLSVATINVGWSKSIEEKIKNAIDNVSDSLKKDVDKLGEDFESAQRYLDNYHWKGIVQDHVSSGPVTLRHFEMNNHSKAVIVHPGDRIKGTVICELDESKASALGYYRVVLGLQKAGAKTTICNNFSLGTGPTLESFYFDAPKVPGVYQVRFRVTQKLLESEAMISWVDEKGNEPDGTTTLGIVVVKE